MCKKKRFFEGHTRKNKNGCMKDDGHWADWGKGERKTFYCMLKLFFMNVFLCECTLVNAL